MRLTLVRHGKTTFFRSYILPYIIIITLLLLVGLLTALGVINTQEKIDAAVVIEQQQTKTDIDENIKLNNTKTTNLS